MIIIVHHYYRYYLYSLLLACLSNIYDAFNAIHFILPDFVFHASTPSYTPLKFMRRLGNWRVENLSKELENCIILRKKKKNNNQPNNNRTKKL